MNFNRFYKNITVRQISLLITSAATVVNTVVFFIVANALPHIWIWTLVFIILSFSFGFFILRFFLEKYVFRKIKLIYKIIYDSKKDPKDPKFKQFGNINLLDVNERVVQWATSTQKEIDSLKSLEEYRKNYVGNISHELKTPIFTIQAYLHTLLDGGLTDDQVNIKYLKRAADNVERLQNIVEDLEIISKLESGQIELDKRKFDIKDLVSDIFLDIEPIAQEKDIKLQFKEGASHHFNIMADRESIRQVLTNLLVNSIKYGKQGGKTKVSFYDMETHILVEVSDNGIGIEEKHLKHVFDRFYRIDTSRSREQGGSGLGLSIVKHIIEAHDQTINIRSTPGVGTTFGFTLEKANKSL